MRGVGENVIKYGGCSLLETETCKRRLRYRVCKVPEIPEHGHQQAGPYIQMIYQLSIPLIQHTINENDQITKYYVQTFSRSKYQYHHRIYLLIIEKYLCFRCLYISKKSFILMGIVNNILP